ncbi:DNA mismatch repair protein MutH [Sandaracinus amylolyticus]|uniref:DNA mismatch repair protein MutH n=1 Tax=Sandaracinus amylolyticus TaxID=927083 RepID=UPI001F28B253|nr:DNA mismatch repair protein MutH [Sandaracinus amylolyticus]UJR81270.1 DNA mismatch repair endonuclease MutH [Sandaracinus amylolyticus]
MTTTPQSERELLARARTLGGRTLAEIARTLEAIPGGDPRRHKGAAGALVERALGAPRTTTARSAPDFEALGVEVKTLPIDARGMPAETTFVAATPRTPEPDWERSSVRRKLARVLWVPIAIDAPFTERRVGSAFLWSPDDESERVLREDWTELMERFALEPEGISARHGRALQLRPKARDASVRVRAASLDGAPLLAAPRAFYLRRTFTAQILDRAGLLRATR